MSSKKVNTEKKQEMSFGAVVGIVVLFFVILAVGAYLRGTDSNNESTTAEAVPACVESTRAAQAAGAELSFDAGYQEALNESVGEFNDTSQPLCVYAQLIVAYSLGEIETARQLLDQLTAIGFTPSTIESDADNPESIDDIERRIAFMESQRESLNQLQLNDVLNEASRPTQ